MPRFLHAVALLVFLTTAFNSANAASAATAGAAAPDFTLPEIGGKKVSLSEYKGKAVVLNFWATWCAPCKAEMPSLNELYLELRNKGLVVLAVAVDSSDKPVRSFAAENKLAFPVLIDKEKEVHFDSYAVMGLPTTFLIDKKGVIVERIIGERDWSSPMMQEKVSKLLSGG